MTLKQTTVEGFFRGLSRFPGVRDNLLTPFSGTDEENDTVGRLVSNLVSRYLNSSDQENPEFVYLNHQKEHDEYCLYLDRRFREQVWIIKNLTFYYVISDSSLSVSSEDSVELLRNSSNYSTKRQGEMTSIRQ